MLKNTTSRRGYEGSEDAEPVPGLRIPNVSSLECYVGQEQKLPLLIPHWNSGESAGFSVWELGSVPLGFRDSTAKTGDGSCHLFLLSLKPQVGYIPFFFSLFSGSGY